jgi:nitronate monooxygenase
MLNLETLRKESAAIRAQTDRPFNFNFFYHPRPIPNAEREVASRAKLARYYEELGLESCLIDVRSGRTPFIPDVTRAGDDSRRE